jgi:hypothetical protein
MSRFVLLVATAAVACPLSGCGGDEAPVVEITSATPQALDPTDDAKDDLTLHLRYEDGDGDVGDGVVDVHDCRAAGLVSTFPVPTIASQAAVDEGVAIEGTLTLVVADVGAAPAGASSPAAACGGVSSKFCVVLTDAAGNESEPACSDPISF